MVQHLKENEFNSEVINFDGISIVDFWAEWCGPCKMISPVLESLNEDVIKVNVDTHPDLAREYGIMSIPAILFFKDGELKDKHVGFTDKETLESIISKIK